MANGHFGGGSGLSDDPYLIEDIYDLLALETVKYGYYKLVNDLDLTEYILENNWTGLNLGLDNPTLENNILEIDGDKHSIIFGEGLTNNSAHLINSISDAYTLHYYNPEIIIKNTKIYSKNTYTNFICNRYNKTGTDDFEDQVIYFDRCEIHLYLNFTDSFYGIGQFVKKLSYCEIFIDAVSNIVLTNKNFGANYIIGNPKNGLYRCIITYRINSNIEIFRDDGASTNALKIYTTNNSSNDLAHMNECIVTGQIKVNLNGTINAGTTTIELDVIRNYGNNYCDSDINLSVSVKDQSANTASDKPIAYLFKTSAYNIYFNGNVYIEYLGSDLHMHDGSLYIRGDNKRYINADRIKRAELNINSTDVLKTDKQMKTQSTFEGWDFDTIWGIDPNINNGYPYLRWYTYKLLVALKVQGTDGIINIPIKEVNTSKQQLIFSLGTENRAVDLVNVNDANASNIRVMTEQGIKAISLY